MFAAWISDDEDPPEALAVKWSAHPIGDFGSGVSTSESGTDAIGSTYDGRNSITVEADIFPIGLHTLTITVTDSHGLVERHCTDCHRTWLSRRTSQYDEAGSQPNVYKARHTYRPPPRAHVTPFPQRTVRWA